MDEKRKWDRGRSLPEALLRRLRDDPWRDMGAARVGDRAFFRPDGLYLEVVRVSRKGVTSHVTGPADAPELAEERTVSSADWVGMFDEGTLLSLPEPPRVGEAWTDSQYGLWFVVAVGEGMAVFEDVRGDAMEVPLGPDGLPSDKGPGWSRVDLDTQGESREGWEGY
jgi:hypothetical protein